MRLLAALSALALAAASSAIGFSDIQNWTGTGSNRAAFVVDWNDGKGPESLLWGYRWNGAATGETMLKAIQANDRRFFASLLSYSFGDAVFGMGYDLNANGGGYVVGTPGTTTETGHALDPNDHYAEGFYNGGWSYYTADNTTTLPTSWTYSQVGFGSRALGDGSWDGWTFDAGYAGATVGTPVPAAPVPEPATLAALGLGALALLRRRRP